MGEHEVAQQPAVSPANSSVIPWPIAAPGNVELDEAVRVVHDRRLDSAVEQGEIPPADTYFLTELLSGPVYLYLIRRRHPFTRAVAEKIADVVLAGLNASAQ
ncbi:TetR-like C-terminal domain-containing protein [Amycolatopsis sp. NPDC049691]|uniref:TetR-like C-terminal domain-containing protein n=1 Tax=Amycolatopsis sp. NPDC049691 TaxID=3155155 RepID=UPI003428F345